MCFRTHRIVSVVQRKHRVLIGKLTKVGELILTYNLAPIHGVDVPNIMFDYTWLNNLTYVSF